MKKLLFILCMFCTLFANAQAGSLDTSFNPTDVGFSKGDGANSQVLASVILPDGKMIIAGSFSTYNGTSVNRICRLNADGNLDPTFVVGTGANSTIHSIALQPDGKIIIGGDFNNYNGIAREKIARLNSDGSLDTTFTVGNGASNTVQAVAVQTDGKIIVGGRFSGFNNLNNRGIVRLNTNGSVDTSFSSAEKPNGDVNALALQPDGKILVGGSFSTYNSIARSNIARINADGTLDSGFTPGTGASSVVYVIKMQSDGKILIGGEFTQYNGVANNRIARLQNNGTLDTAFTTGTAASSTVRAIHMLSDGKIVIGGDFAQYNSVNINNIALLNSNGVLNTTFVLGTGFSSSVYTIAQQADEKIIVGGSFTTYNEKHAPRVVRISTNGAMDTTYNVVSGFNNSVSASVQQTDGKIIVCGGFNNYFNVPTSSLLRLNIDGTVDTSFSTGTGFNRFAYANKLALQPDGKIIVIGNFTSYNGLPYNQAVRINTDGTVDTTFNIGTGLNNGSVNNLVVQPDGKIIIVGMFTNFNGFNINRIVRLNSDGSRDTTFNLGSGPEWFTNVVRLQTDGKIIIGGNFGNYNNITSGGIARLNANGSLDTTFAVGTGFNDPNGISIQTLQIQTDGKIIVAGNFPRYKTTAINRVARLNTDGTLDTTFTVGTGANSQIFSSALQADGKVILGGQFTTYNAVNINRLMRLNTDGTLDTTFNVGTGLDQTPFSATLLSDGKLLIGGAFIGYNGIGRNRLARINTTVHAPVASATQIICGSGTLANLSVTGTNIKWYSAATAGVLLASNTTVVNNTTYYASQTVDGIESASRTAVLVTIGIPAPTGQSVQIYAGTATLANFTVVGTATKWYAAATGGTELPTSTTVTNNVIYYASQTLNACESTTRFAVTARKISEAQQTFCNTPKLVSDLVLTPTTGATASIFNVSTAGTALAATSTLTTGTYYVEQTRQVNSTTLVANGFNVPNGMALQTDGKIVVVNRAGTNKIVRINADGTSPQTLFTGAGNFKDVKVATNGQIYFLDGDAPPAIKRINSDGTGLTTIATGFIIPGRLALDSNSQIWVTDSNANTVKKMNIDGTNVVTVTTAITSPHGIAIQADGKILVTNVNSGIIHRMNADGTGLVTLASGQNSPYEILEQTDGKIVFANVFGAVVRRMNADGTGIENIGTGHNFPRGLALESNGNILVLNEGINSINRISFTNEISARVTVGVTVVPLVAAPTASAQSFCNAGTVANLIATGTGTIKWYASATATTALAPTTALVAGAYFASQTIGTCESLTRTSVAVTITTPVAPTASAQTFCNSGTVANLIATGTGTIKWYASATATTALAPTTTLVAGNYFASQTIGTCESLTRTSVAVTITTPAAPTASAQTICNAGTVGDLVATGTGTINWYASATATTALAPTTALIAGNYFASQTIGTCESLTRTSVAVTITTPAAPTAAAQQFFPAGATVANLAATGSGLKWYSALTAGSLVTNGTTLVNGTTYFVSQTAGVCESTRTAVRATITATAVAINFDGTNDFMRVPNNPLLNFTTGMTVEFWVKPKTTTFNDNFIIGKSAANSWTNGYNISFSGSDKINFSPKGWNNPTLQSTATIPLNTWTHVAGTYDGVTVKLYFNGVLDNQVAATGAIPTNAFDLFIGSDNGTNYFANCDLDMVRLWNIARTQTEIASNRGNCIAASTTGLVAQYDFEEAAGSLAFQDKSGNGLHGSYNNMETVDWIPGDTCGQAFLSVATKDFNANVKVYPNPSNSIFNIEIDANATINVVDMLGKQIMSKKIQSGNAQIDLSNVEQGIYLMKITNESNQQKTIKLMKQ